MRGSTTGNKARVFVETGQRFGRLVVTQTGLHTGQTPAKPAGWRAARCRCDCGAEPVVALSGLVSGKNQSCGCMRREGASAPPPPRTVKHGMHGHPLYYTHCAMMRRCYREDDPHYRWWGGRGIGVWEPWHDVRTFIEDIERELGPRPPGKTLDRWNNDDDYGPGKVRWATPAEQAVNRRNHSQSIT